MLRRTLFVCAVLLASAAALAQEENPANDSVARKDRGEQLGAEHTAQTTKLVDTSTKHAAIELATYADDDHVTVFTPSIAGRIENVLEGASLRGRYIVDVVSAASADVVSTASPRWTEVRNAGSLEATYKPKTFGVTLAGSLSSEPDYFSFGVGSEMTLDLNEKNTTLQAGFGYGHDTVGRCGAENSPAGTPATCTSYGVFSRIINRTSFDLGITQILGKATVASLVADVGLETGDRIQAIPLRPDVLGRRGAERPARRAAHVRHGQSPPRAPARADTAQQTKVSFTGRLAHRFDTSTLKLEERLYADTWALFASTTDARWIFDLGRRVALGRTPASTRSRR